MTLSPFHYKPLSLPRAFLLNFQATDAASLSLKIRKQEQKGQSEAEEPSSIYFGQSFWSNCF
jgi:hypothetical protein